MSEINGDADETPPDFSEIIEFIGYVNRKKTTFRVPNNLRFINEGNNTKLVFLAPESEGSKNQNLYFIDVPNGEFIRNPKWSTYCDFLFSRQARPLSLQEELLYERQRTSLGSGISDFEILSPSNMLLVHLQGSYELVKNENGNCIRKTLAIPSEHTPMHISACPLDNRLIAYVNNHNVYVINSETGSVCLLTDAINDDDETPNTIAGEASYVTQEEFDRYTGFWWQPKSVDNKFRVLYETVNQEAVNTIVLPCFSGLGLVSEKHKYPRVGRVNAKSDLSIVEFDLSMERHSRRTLHLPLSKLYLNYEYLVRAGWLPNGKLIWFTLLTRDQTRMEVFVAPISCFKTQEALELQALDSVEKPLSILTIDAPDTWVSVLPLTFMESKDDETIEMVYLSEEDDFSHIYYQKITVFHNSDGHGIANIDKKQLTCGDYNVPNFWLDEERCLIYYTSFKMSPIFPQFYVTSYKFCGWHKQISEKDDFHHRVKCIDVSKGLVTLEYSNYSFFPGFDIYQIECLGQSDDQPPVLQTTKRCCIFEPVRHYDVMNPRCKFLKYSPPPEVISFTTKDGIKLYGLLFLPENHDQTKLPCIQYVYGGPEVMIVDGYYSYGSMFRFMKWCHFGFAVLVCDNRGSSNRGHSFAAKNKFKLGRVELSDQVEFLEYVSATYKCIDMKRVGITGWSYGGYMTLMAMAQYSHIYKMGIAGGSVTSWYLYDTGYTERYMGLLSKNASQYATSEIEAYASGFPKEANRLFLVHGGADENVHFYHVTELIQILVKFGKPYSLLLYPSDRHRILTGALHLDASMIFYFEKYLKR